MAEPAVVVIGAGIAGTAAAFGAARAGAAVVVLHDRAGASALYSGALDREPWDAELAVVSERADEIVKDEALVGFVQALGGYRLGHGMIATQAGVVRPALGADDALLELGSLAGRRVAVADVERDDWDAPLIARVLGASAWAVRTRTVFLPVPLRLLRTGHERRIAPYDFAALHDDAARRSALAESIRAASAGVDGWLFGPWLGLEPETVTILRKLVPLPLGETTSLMGGPAGARFEAARDRLLAARHVDARRGRVTRVSRRGSRWVVTLATENGAPATHPPEVEARAVVLATGGVGAGGVALTRQPPQIVSGFALPFAAPVALGLDGETLGGGGSLHGPSLELRGLGLLERVGIRADPDGRAVGEVAEETGLFVAGDAVVGRPRTMLEAALAGLGVGALAARE